MKVQDKPADTSNPALDNVEDIYPLTPLQEGMVFHTITDPGTAMHVGRIVFHLRGKLDLKSFREAWDTLLARHPALRTAFVWEGLEAPMQVVRKELSIPFRHHSWTELATNQADQQFNDWLWRDAIVGFDLVDAPLCRVDVFSFSPENHRIIWACHHAVADGWSIGIALEELLTIARGIEHDRLPKAPRYRNHIAWLLKRDASGDERFWHQYLKGFNERTSITPLLPSPPTENPDRRQYTTHAIAADALGPITSAAKAARVTLNTLFQAAWALVLGRYAASDDVVFGVVSSGRPDSVPGVERMVGLLVTTTPMRVQIRDRHTVRSLLKRLQADSTTIRDHEHAALTKIQTWSDMAPGEALFDCIYVFGNYPPQSQPSGSELSIESIDIKAPSTFPLAVLVDPDGQGGLVVTAVTDPSRFTDNTARRIVDAVVTTAYALASDLDAAVATIECIPTAESATLAKWGQGCDPSTPQDDIIETIEGIAERLPNTLAAAGGAEELTYSLLLNHARAAASVLVSLGIETGEPVIVLMDRGPKAIVGIMSVLLAGGAYVPLDPTYPLLRRSMAVEDSGARFIVTDKKEVDGLDHLTIIDVDEIEPRPPQDWVRKRVSPATPAYIIYTSGSSGRPKGVVVSRSNLSYSNAARWAFYDEQPKAFLLLSSLAFDSSVAGLFWTLSTGGTLVFAEHRLEQDVERLAARIEAYNVTHLLCLPSLYAVLIDHADRRQLSSLTHAIVAGEACPPSLPHRHRAALPATKLINEYGPTEATVWCIASDITDTPTDEMPSIGRPIQGTTIRLVDHRNRPVPRDAAGELVIGGPGVALGYHRQPEMTAASFVSSDVDGMRFYRTGDFARWRSDGSLDCLGRRDAQLKVRGHRIELPEIEVALQQAPRVKAAAVAATRNEQHGVRLVAFVEGHGVELETIRHDLANRLPDAMLPSTINAVPTLPRLPNGKIDRTKLLTLAEDEAERQKEQQYQAPTSPTEQALVEIWKKVLNVGLVGIQDDFFSLGGDSLASIRIVSLARRAGLKVKPTSVLEFPTIRALARSMEASERPSDAKKPTSSRRFFLVHGGERVRDCLQDAFGDRYAVHQFDDHWDDGRLSPRTSVNGMADQYLAELQTISPHGPYLLGGYSIGAAVSLVMARRLMAAGEDVDLLFLLDPLHRVEFFGGIEGLDPETLNAVSAPPHQEIALLEQTLAPGYRLLQKPAIVPDLLFKTYTRYVRGPTRLIRGAVAYYLGRPLSPKIASHYAWIVYNLAIKKHKLSPYSGRLLVFRSVLGFDLSKDYLWAKLARGNYAEERFNCEHVAFRRDPEIVKTWTQRLAEHLHRMT